MDSNLPTLKHEQHDGERKISLLKELGTKVNDEKQSKSTPQEYLTNMKKYSKDLFFQKSSDRVLFQRQVQPIKLPNDRCPPNANTKPRKYVRSKTSAKIHPPGLHYLKKKEKLRGIPPRMPLPLSHQTYNSNRNVRPPHHKYSRSTGGRGHSGSVFVVSPTPHHQRTMRSPTSYTANHGLNSAAEPPKAETRVIVKKINDILTIDTILNNYERIFQNQQNLAFCKSPNIKFVRAETSTAALSLLSDPDEELSSILDDVLDMEETYPIRRDKPPLQGTDELDPSMHTGLTKLHLKTLVDIYNVDVTDKFEDIDI